jgi:hypothetical protein
MKIEYDTKPVRAGTKEDSGAPGGTRTPDLLVRSQFSAPWQGWYRMASLGFSSKEANPSHTI